MFSAFSTRHTHAYARYCMSKSLTRDYTAKLQCCVYRHLIHARSTDATHALCILFMRAAANSLLSMPGRLERLTCVASYSCARLQSFHVWPTHAAHALCILFMRTAANFGMVRPKRWRTLFTHPVFLYRPGRTRKRFLGGVEHTLLTLSEETFHFTPRLKIALSRLI